MGCEAGQLETGGWSLYLHVVRAEACRSTGGTNIDRGMEEVGGWGAVKQWAGEKGGDDEVSVFRCMFRCV